MSDSLVRVLLDQLADKVEAEGFNRRLASDRELAQLIAAHRPSIIPPHTCHTPPRGVPCLACWMSPIPPAGGGA